MLNVFSQVFDVCMDEQYKHTSVGGYPEEISFMDEKVSNKFGSAEPTSHSNVPVGSVKIGVPPTAAVKVVLAPQVSP